MLWDTNGEGDVAVDDPTTVDGLGTDKVTGEVVLLISDHLTWRDEELHLRALVAKINGYLSFVHGGQLQEAMPASVGRKCRISLICESEPPDSAAKALDTLAAQLQTQSIGFTYGALPTSY